MRNARRHGRHCRSGSPSIPRPDTAACGVADWLRPIADGWIGGFPDLRRRKRHPSILKNPSISNPIEPLEPRCLLSTTNLPVDNPDFALFDKPGSTTVTAIVPASDVTDGLGAGVAVATLAGGTPATVNYSDGTTGSTVDVPGWSATPANPFSPPAQYVGVLGDALGATQAPAPGTFAQAFITGDYPSGEQITQTLSDITLQPNATYVLSVASNAQAADGSSLPNVVIGLEADGTMLVPSSSSDPAASNGGTVVSGTYTRTFTTGATPPSGALTIVLGAGAGDTGANPSVNFTAVTLTSTVAAAPSGVLAAPVVTDAGAATETITATFTSAAGGAGIDLASIAPASLSVTGPTGSPLTVTRVTTNPASGSPTSVTATYTVAAPAGGWTTADNGTYTVSLNGGAVTDTAGNAVPSVSTTFAVSVLPRGLTQGSSDPTFAPGTAGQVNVAFFAEQSAIAANGSIYVVGQEPGATTGSTQGVLERLNANGTPDATFGATGVVTDSATADEDLYGVQPLADGQVLVTGDSNGSLLLARYDSDGTLDASFGTGGRVVVPIANASSATAYAVALDPTSGDYLIGGAAGGQFLVDRFTPSGAPDPAFNGGQPQLFGTVAGQNAVAKVVVLSDGSIIGAGPSASNVVAVRLNADGSLDTAFNSTGAAPGLLVIEGLTTQDLGTGLPDTTEGLAVDPQGNVLVANSTAAGQFGTVRITPAGALDTTFGTDGLVTTSFGGDDDADEVLVQPDGSQIIVVGTSTSGSVVQTAVAAYLPSGALDTTFGTGGKELLALGAATPSILTLHAGAVAPLAVSPILNHIDQIVAALGNDVVLVGSSQQNGMAVSSTFTRLTTAGLPAGTLGVAVAAKLPASVVSGAKTATTVTVTIHNPTAQLISGRATITLYFSQAQTLIGATQLMSAPAVLKLKPGQSKALKLKLRSFPTETAGAYTLIAVVTAPDGTTTGSAGPSALISPSFVSLTASALRPTVPTVVPGKRGALVLTITDAGNVPVSGSAPLTLTITSAGGSPITLATLPLKVSLKAGQSKPSAVKFTVPPTVPAGTYTLTADLAVTGFGDGNPTDGIAMSAVPLTVK
jgi:uncharacterized delta-60 repeat protein